MMKALNNRTKDLPNMSHMIFKDKSKCVTSIYKCITSSMANRALKNLASTSENFTTTFSSEQQCAKGDHTYS